VGDFVPSNEAECFFGDGYSMRYRFTSGVKAGAADKVSWDFGDGQSGTGSPVDHVYLTAGIYDVKATVHHDGNADTQTNRVVVERDYRHLLVVHEDTAGAESKIAADYDLSKMHPADLNRVVLLHLEAEKLDPAVAAAERLAACKSFDDPSRVNGTLLKLQQKLLDAGRPEAAIGIWDKVPADSKLQPVAAASGAALAVWWTGDVDKAVKLLTPFKDQNDPSLKRTYAESLVLAGRVDEGKKILTSMESDLPANRRSALSGASARSVEFFITEKDADAGEAAWNKWQAKFPTDFLEGYSVVLRTKLMAERKRPEAAAKIAEAFALAVPKSSYSPQLLDSASRLMAKIDLAKSDSLRKTLKEKYPEDPLSQ
jgi:PKD repeat protein